MEDEPAPRAAETLGILKARGLSLGIVSNNTSKVRGALEGLGLERSFGSVVISEEVGLYKPDPAILELACKQLGAAPWDSVYVGGHPFDILCAHSAHMPVIWMPANPYMRAPEHIGPPEHRVESLNEPAWLLE